MQVEMQVEMQVGLMMGLMMGLMIGIDMEIWVGSCGLRIGMMLGRRV